MCLLGFVSIASALFYVYACEYCFCFSFCVCLYAGVYVCMWVGRVFCWGLSFSSLYIYICISWFCSPLPLLEVLYINQSGRTFLRAFEKATYDHSVAKGQLRQVAITGCGRGWSSWICLIHPGRLTWNLQITHLERKMIFQTSMIMVHVNLPGCKVFFFNNFLPQ